MVGVKKFVLDGSTHESLQGPEHIQLTLVEHVHTWRIVAEFRHGKAQQIELLAFAIEKTLSMNHRFLKKCSLQLYIFWNCRSPARTIWIVIKQHQKVSLQLWPCLHGLRWILLNINKYYMQLSMTPEKTVVFEPLIHYKIFV